MNVDVLGFLLVSFLIAVAPGPSIVYVVSYSLRYGAKAGIVSTLGINAGSIVAILIAAFGLTTLIKIVPDAINYIQLIGGLYIMYLAIMMWPKEPSTGFDGNELREQSYQSLFKNGFITSILNPKDILFYTAFIPTFIPVGVAAESYQSCFLLLAFSYMLTGFVTKSLFAVFSGYAKAALHSKHACALNYASAGILFLLGIFLFGNTMVAMWL